MHIKAPRLSRNRLGVFYFRLKSGGIDRRISLRTRCPHAANILALQLNLSIERSRAMRVPAFPDIDADAIRKYEIDIGRGIYKTDGTAADHAAMMQALERIGPIDPEDRPPRSATATARAALQSLPIGEAVKLWLEECKGKNAPRTVDAKRYHAEDFIERTAKGAEVDHIGKPSVVAYKAALQREGQTAKTIDNKLMSLFDLFKYLSNHGLYSPPANPVAGLFMLTKTERKKKNQPYDAFTPDEVARIFEPSSYLAAMTAPDLFWGPLLGAYTGMRISEATAIKAEDVKHAKGVHFIHIPKSKTSAGVRDVPICDALLSLGFLDYVAEVRAAGAPHLFAHRLIINGGYSKELSAAMLARRKAVKIEDPNDRKSFHSFRVGVSTALANAGANTMQAMRIVGHNVGDSVEVHAGYVRELPDLLKVANLVKQPIDLSALKYAGQFRDFIANCENWAEVRSEAKAADLARRRANRARLSGAKAKP